MSKVKVCADKAELGSMVGGAIAAMAEKAIANKGNFVVAFSGGSLPVIIAPYLISKQDAIQWAKWTVVFADERVVSDGHSDLNLVACKKALFDKVPIPAANIVGIDVSSGLDDVDAVARKYEASLSKVTRGTFSVDMALLGMGPDGHTCSLFPNHKLLQESKRYIAPIVDSPKLPPKRVTFTLPTIRLAKQVIFVTAGASKAEVLPLAIKGDSNVDVPASFAKGAGGFNYWFVDKAAAGKL